MFSTQHCGSLMLLPRQVQEAAISLRGLVRAAVPALMPYSCLWGAGALAHPRGSSASLPESVYVWPVLECAVPRMGGSRARQWSIGMVHVPRVSFV